MLRQPSIRYFASHKAYYCQFRGKQHLLASGPKDFPDGPTHQAVLKAFGKLAATGDIEKAKDNNQVQVILEKYVQHAQTKLKESTFPSRLYLLQSFQQAFNVLPICELTHFKIEFSDRSSLPHFTAGESCPYCSR